MEVGVQVGSPLRFACDLTSAENSDNASDEPILVTQYVAPALVEHVAPASAVTYTALVPVIEHVAHVPAHVHATPATVIEDAAPAPAVTYTTPAPVIEYTAPALAAACAAPTPVIEYVHVHLLSPTQHQLL